MFVLVLHVCAVHVNVNYLLVEVAKRESERVVNYFQSYVGKKKFNS
jgi:hypothetical protein